MARGQAGTSGRNLLIWMGSEGWRLRPPGMTDDLCPAPPGPGAAVSTRVPGRNGIERAGAMTACGRAAPSSQRIGASPAPNAVKMRVSSVRKPRLTSGKSPTGSWQARKPGSNGDSGAGHCGPGWNS